MSHRPDRKGTLASDLKGAVARAPQTGWPEVAQTGLPLRLLRVVPDLRVRMRRAASPPRGEARPQKHICPPQTRSPRSDLSQPPPEAWCAERVHPNFSSVWQLRDVFVFPPLQSVLLPPVGRVLGDTVGSLLQRTDPVLATCQSSTSLSINPNKDAGGFPSWWRTSLLPGLLDTPSQVCLPLHDTLLPLSHFIHEWEHLPGVSLWVLRTIWYGYTLQFGRNPPRFDGVQLTVVNTTSKASVLQQELSFLLQKGAKGEIPQSDIERRFFSRYFFVPKRDGGLRPILGLRHFNFSLYKGNFKMLTMKTIMSQIQGGDWFVTIDLKDAYFHIQVVQRHRRFLRFAFGGKAYQYKVLSFGLALAPRTFTKCMDAALAALRLQGIRVLNYLDDWLILAHSRELVIRHRDIVLRHIHSLGLRMNAKKSVLLPSQRTVFLGVRLDSIQMQARLAPARISNFTACLARFKLARHVSVGTCRRLLGLMASASPVLPLGLLHMRPFLWWMKELSTPHCTSHSPYQGVAQLLSTPFTMAGPRFSPERGENGCDPLSPYDHDGRINDRLGRGLRRQTGKRGTDRRVPAVLCRVKVSSPRLLLIAPFWPSQTWFSELTPLLYRSPWEIPIRRDLLSQLQGKIWHPQPELWKLWVWPIQGQGPWWIFCLSRFRRP